MDQNTARRIIALQDLTARDDRYMDLLRAFQQLYIPVERILDSMRNEEREKLEEYSYLFAQMHLRMLEMSVNTQSFFKIPKNSCSYQDRYATILVR